MTAENWGVQSAGVMVYCWVALMAEHLVSCLVDQWVEYSALLLAAQLAV